MRNLSRRDLLRLTPLAAVPFLASAQAQEPRFSGHIVRMREPRNLETPADGLAYWLTKADQFYVRNHFAQPKLDAATYRLSVTGHVEAPLELSLDELRKDAKTVPLTLECAGNGRVFLTPQVRGLQWGIGAVGTAEWTGIPLGAILERAKVKAGAVDVILVGADSGAITADPSSPGVISFDRSLPLAKAKQDEVILATAMNGDPLPASHGAPVRAVVGGWYGMASVKWLTKVIVTDRPYGGFWQTLDYSVWERRHGLPTLVPITAMQPKAVIVSPGLNAAVAAGKPVTVSGMAWAGEKKVAKVELSADGGTTWAAATLTGAEKPFCWRSWEYAWTPTTRGPAQLLARATDAAGATQPDKRDPDRRSYMINHLVPTEVTVR
jgi:DMSO/TMAO reductase YedYZ molybdopterin-dependent catalytic subunit